MSISIGFSIMRTSEYAALIASRRHGRVNATDLISEVREIILRDLRREDCNFYVRNDRFAGHKSISKIPEEIVKDPSLESFDLQTVSVDGHKVATYSGGNVASYITVAEKDSLMPFPYLYMNKIAVGQEAYGVVDIREAPSANVKRVARALKKYVENITVCFLDRDRNKAMIEEVKACGARIALIQDGDISASLATAFDGRIDMMMGYGGAQEGVLTAAGMKCLGGYIVGQLYLPNSADEQLAKSYGINDLEAVYDIDDLVKSDKVAFTATGITDGYFLDGVRFEKDGDVTHSIMAKSDTKTLRKVRTRHYFDFKQIFS